MASMRLLERDDALATLRELAAERSSGGRLVLIAGEAGVGKTSLIRAFRSGLPPGTRSFAGACDPLSTPSPLGPLVEIADELDPAFAAVIRAERPRSEVLRAFLTGLGRAGSGGAGPTSDGPVVFLEDLHWADEATLDALRFAGRRIESTGALLVGTYRDDEIGRLHPLRVLIGDLASSTAVRRLSLLPLSVAAVEELVGGTGIDASALHALTGGNPFYVTEVIASGPTAIPATVRDAVLGRAARLSAHGRATLDAAAVIGPVVDPSLLSSIVEAPAADECLSVGLLQANGRTYDFRHELGRQAILEAIDPATRRVLHGRVLAALEAGPADARSDAIMAHHADGAEDHGALVRYAIAAARAASAASAHREAAAQLARAHRHADLLPPAERAELLVAFARERTAIGSYDDAPAALEEAAEMWHSLGDLEREARTIAQLAKFLLPAGRNQASEVAGRRAMDLAIALGDDRIRLDALAAQAFVRMLDRDNQAAIEFGRQAIALGGDDPSVAGTVAEVHGTVGAARILAGDFDGRADLERSMRQSAQLGDERTMLLGYQNLASSLAEMYRFAEADAVFAAGIQFARDRDLDAARGYLEVWLAIANLERGRWSEVGPAVAPLGSSPNAMVTRIMAAMVLGRLRARRGDPDVWAILDEALALAAPTGTLQRLGPVHAARAEAAWTAGDRERAADEAAAAFELAVEKAHPWYIGELAWWQAQAGRHVPDDGAAEPWRLQLAGMPRAAADAWLALDCPYQAARALLDSTVVDDVVEAHEAFDALGASPGVAMATRRLRELGAARIPRGRRAATRANPAGLTGRELEIVGLLVAGLANADIAARLYLSTRTVDHHVSAALGKLGVARRQDVAAAVAAAGIELQDGQSSGAD
jgi:DNA-binding CsgD family transcriptional regulator